MRPEPFRRACLLRYEQMALVAVCACSAGCEVHSAGLWYMLIRWDAFGEAPLTPAWLPVGKRFMLCFGSLFQSFGVSQ